MSDYNENDVTTVAAVVWQAVFGESNPTTPLSKMLAADRAARALLASDLTLPPEALHAVLRHALKGQRASTPTAVKAASKGHVVTEIVEGVPRARWRE